MENISTLSIVSMEIAAFVCFFGPILLMLFWKKATHRSVKPALFGAFIFILFAMILESVLHTFVLTKDGIVYNNPILYVIYGVLAAGIFEEGGRFVAFRFLLKNHDTKEDAVMYGIGHGGIEVMLLVGFSLISSIVLAVTINNMGPEQFIESFSPAQISDIHAVIQTLQSFTPLQSFLSLFERCSAMILHISCSIFVYHAVKHKDWKYIAFAIVFHALMNTPAALYQVKYISSLVLVEILIFIVACIAAYLAINLYKNETAE